MAKTLKPNGGETPDHPTNAHNTKARGEAISDALEELYKADVEIAVLLEKHITPLREDKQAVKKRLREDYNLTTKLVNARYGIYKAEREAMDNKDDTTIDVLRELFEVRPVGHQADWIAAQEEAEARADA